MYWLDKLAELTRPYPLNKRLLVTTVGIYNFGEENAKYLACLYIFNYESIHHVLVTKIFIILYVPFCRPEIVLG